jgi:hypothetical protein
MMKLIAIIVLASNAAAGTSSSQARPITDTSIESGMSNVMRVWDNCGHGRYRTSNFSSDAAAIFFTFITPHFLF